MRELHFIHDSDITALPFYVRGSLTVMNNKSFDTPSAADETIADQAELPAMVQRMATRDERERLLGKRLRKAVHLLGPLIQDLPATDIYLLAPAIAEAWRILHDEDPECFIVYLAQVRQRCGPVVAQLVQSCVALPVTGSSHELRAQTVESLLAQEFPLWLVDRRMPERGLAICYGKSGSGKTFLALDMACAVALGVDWFGRTTKARWVIYVSSEGRMRNRIEAYKTHRNLSEQALNLIRFIEQPVNLTGRTRDIKQLISIIERTAEELGSLGLVVIDTVARAMTGSDENSGKDMGAFIAAIQSIEEACNGLVLLVHHSGKDATRGARGHSSLHAACDAEIEVTRDDASGIRTAKVTKLRDAEDGEKFTFRLDPIAFDDSGRSSCVVVAAEPSASASNRTTRALSGAAGVALQALQEAISDHGQLLPATSTIPGGVWGTTIQQWRMRFGNRYGTDDEGSEREDQAVQKAFQRGREALLKYKLVGISTPFCWPST